jgi:patatin-like phospholipase/acyl hydrolase
MPGAENTFLWEIAVQTASAPVYFPSYNGFIDGGTSMNNPAAKAVQVAINRGFMLEDISLLAITTGSGPLYKASKRNDWGLTQWGPNIISLIMRLTEQTSLDLLQLNRLGFYAIADYKLTSEIPLDDVKWAKSFGANSYQKNDKASKAIREFKATLHDS